MVSEKKIFLGFPHYNPMGAIRCHGHQSCEFQNFFNSNDVILITESWTNEYSDIEVSNFDSFVLHRKEKKKGCKRNSGGIVLYIRSKYVTRNTLVYTSQDDIIWAKFDKALFSMNTDLYVGLCYVIPDDSSRQSLIDTNIFDRLLALWRIEDTTEMVFGRKKRRFVGRKQSK